MRHVGSLGQAMERRESDSCETALTPMERVRVAEMEDEMRRLRMENEFLKKAAVNSRV